MLIKKVLGAALGVVVIVGSCGASSIVESKFEIDSGISISPSTSNHEQLKNYEIAAQNFVSGIDMKEFQKNEISENFVQLLEKIAYGTFNESKTISEDVCFRKTLANAAIKEIKGDNKNIKIALVCLALKGTSGMLSNLLANTKEKLEKERKLDELNNVILKNNLVEMLEWDSKLIK